MTNLLASETSPYLQQHKDNPVHWRPWGPEALAEAQRSNKLLLVSVGYAACHWCHVMAHESFEDAETANLMNDLYVCVKVDREERPDIDGWLQKVPPSWAKRGGWPLNAFLTPKGEPFWGGTISQGRKFRPSVFKTVLRDIAGAIRNRPTRWRPMCARFPIISIRPGIRTAPASSTCTSSTVSRSPPHRIATCSMAASRAAEISQRADSGIDVARFPAHRHAAILSLSLVALDNMGRGGIYDHVGGGFARYATTISGWIPHFEKMLYDNAQLIDI
jgi:uncharacterized protein YyaL (SSP411 family)